MAKNVGTYFLFVFYPRKHVDGDLGLVGVGRTELVLNHALIRLDIRLD